ncbi:hypothetical protein SAMN05518801_106189 [Novosphingobium sp. CF614]|uniref:hypothetical protein n=1 Tax=Novosphingobium sp. CF614 TaxID=1884364 RepID=UPI0008E24B36|nr:hypothetical protein [Novosphingobium sp. CF614]SFG05858.1 hypothetical protein SAMN05518801_106189 [Novosphingobium sp. CF614]
MRKQIGLGLALLWTLLSSAPATATGWNKAESNNFVIYSDGPAATLKEFAETLERFDTLLRALLNTPQEDHPSRLTVYLLDTSSDIGTLVGNQSVAGFYHPDIAGSYVVASRLQTSRYEAGGLPVLFHEYGHHFMFRHFEDIAPLWYQEGFAEFVSTVDFTRDGIWTIGKVDDIRAYDVMHGNISIEELLGLIDEKPSTDDVSMIYARGWLLVHMLNFDQSRQGQLIDYLQRFRRGQNLKEAAAAFGNLKKLDADLRKYAVGRVPFRRANTPLVYSGEIRIVPLDDIDSRLAALSLNIRIARLADSALEELRTLAQRYPEAPRVIRDAAIAETDRVLGVKKAFVSSSDDNKSDDLAESESKDLARVEAFVDHALEISPREPSLHLAKARLMLHSLNQRQGTTQEWSQVRREIAAANNIDPNDPQALYLYYQSYAQERIVPPASAQAALGRAYELIPEVNEVRIAYALDLANQHHFAEAISVMTVLANNPHASSGAKKILAAIEQMEQSAKNEQVTIVPNS